LWDGKSSVEGRKEWKKENVLGGEWGERERKRERWKKDQVWKKERGKEEEGREGWRVEAKVRDGKEILFEVRVEVGGGHCQSKNTQHVRFHYLSLLVHM